MNRVSIAVAILWGAERHWRTWYGRGLMTVSIAVAILWGAELRLIDAAFHRCGFQSQWRFFGEGRTSPFTGYA
jgi:hypothetical protein